VAAMLSRGSFDPLIITQGTIAYLFTFDKGYRFIWLDSGGPITPQLIGVMNRVGKTNLAIASYTVQGIPDLPVPVTMAPAELFQPDIFTPSHTAQTPGSANPPPIPGGFVLPDMATEPLRLEIRSSMPETRAITPIYRTPIVVDMRSGHVSVG